MWIFVVFYLLMGWLIFIPIKEFIEVMELAGLLWIAAGGAAYTLGVLLTSPSLLQSLYLAPVRASWYYLSFHGGNVLFLLRIHLLIPSSRPVALPSRIHRFINHHR